MTDRELLELAAKAAGVEIHGWFGDDSNESLFADIGPDDVIEWSPLTDDGDALRLAVKLYLQIHINNGYGAAVRRVDGNWHACESHKFGDLNAATRRAIVRAAAEIGEVMP